MHAENNALPEASQSLLSRMEASVFELLKPKVLLAFEHLWQQCSIACCQNAEVAAGHKARVKRDEFVAELERHLIDMWSALIPAQFIESLADDPRVNLTAGQKKVYLTHVEISQIEYTRRLKTAEKSEPAFIEHYESELLAGRRTAPADADQSLITAELSPAATLNAHVQTDASMCSVPRSVALSDTRPLEPTPHDNHPLQSPSVQTVPIGEESPTRNNETSSPLRPQSPDAMTQALPTQQPPPESQPPKQAGLLVTTLHYELGQKYRCKQPIPILECINTSHVKHIGNLVKDEIIEIKEARRGSEHKGVQLYLSFQPKFSINNGLSVNNGWIELEYCTGNDYLQQDTNIKEKECRSSVPCEGVPMDDALSEASHAEFEPDYGNEASETYQTSPLQLSEASAEEDSNIKTEEAQSSSQRSRSRTPLRRRRVFRCHPPDVSAFSRTCVSPLASSSHMSTSRRSKRTHSP
ncbi:MAG: hypothetical protein NZ807_08310 [Dehalococcoidia bacterium]|nr:hypothetical protein [Dehalococcoidia bacterium]